MQQGFIKKDRLYLNLVTLGPELCQLVLVWLMTLGLEPCHSGGIFLELTTDPNSKNFTEMFLMVYSTKSHTLVYVLLKTMTTSPKTRNIF